MLSAVPRHANICRYVNAVVIVLIAISVFIVPVITIWSNISDQKFSGEEIPSAAWKLHRKISPKYARWARQRIESGKAGSLHLYDVPSTEWPMFGSVFYLWSTESLQKAWEKDKSLSKTAPAEYAREAIEASLELILDPVHHSWVRTHWGTDYMHDQNVFFRSLIIAGIISHEYLLGTGEHLELLRDQVDSLAKELDESPHGVLEDYPMECYPIDVFMVVAMIKRGAELLEIDHSDFIDRSIRAFEGEMLDDIGLIPYFMHAETGRILSPSRGVGNSHILIYANELWPARAKAWYDLYEKHFWQDMWWASGFREYTRDLSGLDWSYDVDAGPIIAGFGPAANAFGAAAAKINGRLDHAYTLSSQVFAACLPTFNGRLLGAMLLSDWDHAPYLGEVCILYFLTQTPAEGVEIIKGGFLPPDIYIGSVLFIGIGGLLIFMTARGLCKWRRQRQRIKIPAERFQFAVWAVILLSAIVVLFLGVFWKAAAMICVALAFPVCEVGRKG